MTQDTKLQDVALATFLKGAPAHLQNVQTGYRVMEGEEPVCVVIPYDEYEQILAHQRLLEGIAEGLDDVQHGRVIEASALEILFP